MTDSSQGNEQQPAQNIPQPTPEPPKPPPTPEPPITAYGESRLDGFNGDSSTVEKR